MPAKKKKVKFENALDDLESLVEKMEAGELSLDESMQAFERGIELTRQCQQALDEAEQKVQILISEDKQDMLVDFDRPGQEE